MENTAEKLYNSLVTIHDIQRLIDEGEAEGQYLECKSPQSPLLDRGLKEKFAEQISGFANAGGGIIIWGVSTTPHEHSKIDVLSQIEEIGSINNFKKQVDLSAITLIEPQIISCQSKIIFKTPKSTRGILITFVPPTPGDPIRTTANKKFYIRVGNSRSEMSYETIKRMFAGTSGPDLSPHFDSRLVKLRPDDSWEIPIVIENNSSAAAKDTEISLSIINRSACESINAEHFTNQSHINPGECIFMSDFHRPIFREKGVLVGNLIVKMKKQKLPKRKLELKIDIFATNMRAKTYTMVVQLIKKGFVVKKAKSNYLY